MKGKSIVWDRPLSKQEVWKLSPRDAHLRLLTSMERKVLFLEDVVERRHIPFEVIKKLAGTRTAFRQWENVKLRIWKWSVVDADRLVDPETGEKCPNYDLMARWKSAITALRALPERAAVEGSQKSDQSEELTRQNLALIARNAFLEAELLKVMRRTK